MIKLLLRLCGIERMSRDAVLMDHLPIPEPVSVEVAGLLMTPADNRWGKVAAARAKLGRAFRCAAPDQDREVMVEPGIFRTVGAGMVAPRDDVPSIFIYPSPPPTVSLLGPSKSGDVVALESRRRL